MRDVILIGLATFLIMFSAVTLLHWFSRSSALRNDAESMFTELNNELKASGASLGYDSLSVSGFPLYMRLTIANPHFTGNLDKALADLQIKEVLKTGDLPTEIHDYKLEGSVVFSVNMPSNHFTAETITKSGKNNICEVEIANPSGLFGELWSFNSITKSDRNMQKSLISACGDFLINFINSIFISQHA